MTIAHWSGFELIQLPTLNAHRSSLNSEEKNQASNIKHQTFLWWWIFYSSLALGFLAKGPIAWTPLLTVGAIIIYMRDWQLPQGFKLVRGTLLTLAMVALWGIPALIQTHGEFFSVGIGRHVIGRSFATMEGHGANSLWMYLLLLPFYFVTVFVGFFPWSIQLPSLIRNLWRERKAGLIFTVIKTKLPHYTLPAFPLLALLLARNWQTTAARRRSLFPTAALITAGVWIAIALLVPPIVARFFPAYQLCQQSRASLQPKMQFASVEFEEPSLVWYFRSRVKGFLTPLNRRRAPEFMSAPGPHFVILPTPVAGTLFANQPQNWKFFSTSGFNIAKGKRVDLTLVLKPE
ncbi:MAG: hypothetical protein DME92_11835 [Verrucomicrobia bacterium]|nr:MAG: hypothetical protein DME92_11835 [Verrucomicrobiota bacterium]